MDKFYFVMMLYAILPSAGIYKLCLPKSSVQPLRAARQRDNGKLPENKQRKEISVMGQYEYEVLQS